MHLKVEPTLKNVLVISMHPHVDHSDSCTECNCNVDVEGVNAESAVNVLNSDISFESDTKRALGFCSFAV